MSVNGNLRLAYKLLVLALHWSQKENEV